MDSKPIAPTTNIRVCDMHARLKPARLAYIENCYRECVDSTGSNMIPLPAFAAAAGLESRDIVELIGEARVPGREPIVRLFGGCVTSN